MRGRPRAARSTSRWVRVSDGFELRDRSGGHDETGIPSVGTMTKKKRAVDEVAEQMKVKYGNPIVVPWLGAEVERP